MTDYFTVLNSDYEHLWLTKNSHNKQFVTISIVTITERDCIIHLGFSWGEICCEEIRKWQLSRNLKLAHTERPLVRRV